MIEEHHVCSEALNMMRRNELLTYLVYFTQKLTD